MQPTRILVIEDSEVDIQLGWPSIKRKRITSRNSCGTARRLCSSFTSTEPAYESLSLSGLVPPGKRPK